MWIVLIGIIGAGMAYMYFSNQSSDDAEITDGDDEVSNHSNDDSNASNYESDDSDDD